MRPKIFRAFLQMEEMWGDHEREGVRRTPRYLKDETRSIGRREIVSGGNWLKREGRGTYGRETCTSTWRG